MCALGFCLVIPKAKFVSLIRRKQNIISKPLVELTAYLWTPEHHVLSQTLSSWCLCHSHSNSPSLWRTRKGNWEFTWQQLDPKEAFRMQHRPPFCSGPPSPCCTQAAEESFAGRAPWMAFLHSSTWSTSGLKELCCDEQQSLRFL